jgi:hypothetical protein
MIANIASDDALILPHRANPAGLNFRERQPIPLFDLFSDQLTHVVLQKFILPTANVKQLRRDVAVPQSFAKGRQASCWPPQDCLFRTGPGLRNHWEKPSARLC